MAVSYLALSARYGRQVAIWSSSALLHLCVLLAVGTISPSPADGRRPVIAVELVAPQLEVSRPVTPPAPPAGPAPAAAPGVRAPDGVARSQADADPEGEVFVAPPPPPGAAAPSGLAGLASRTDCDDPAERLKDKCRSRWADKIPLDAQTGARSIEAMRESYPGFVSPFAPPVPIRREGVLGQGIGRTGPGRGGAAGLGGANEMVGRLPPPTPYHVDPGFGD